MPGSVRVTRVLQTGGFDYWESGMDLHLGDDMYDSFVAYQNRMRIQFDQMAENYGFTVIDACRSIDAVFGDLKGQMGDLLYTASPAATDAAERLKQSRPEAAAQDLGGGDRLAKQYAS